MSQLQFRKIVLPDAPVKLTPKVPERDLPVASEVIATSAPDYFAPDVPDQELPPVAPAGNYASLTTKFLLAGKATFTISNPKGDHYTFKVRRVESEYPPNSGKMGVTFFVSVKAAGGKWPYRYIGLLNKDDGGIKCTAKSEYVNGTKEYNVAAWACATVIGHKLLPDGYKIEHAGQCGKCGKTLTDPLSIERGIGPDCWETL